MIHYSKVAIPDTYTILGLKLKPFCIGHYILMDRYNCAMVSGKDAVMNFDDFLLGVSICHRTYEDFLALIDNKEEFFNFHVAWRQAVTEQVNGDKDFDMLYRINLFKKYMTDGSVMPDVVLGDNEGGQESGGHWTQAVLLVLTGELNYTQSEALNCPLSKAFYDFYKFLEKNGSGRLFTEEEIKRMNELKKAQENQQIKETCPV